MKISRKSKLKFAEVVLVFASLILLLKIFTNLTFLISPEYTLAVLFAAFSASDFIRAIRVKPTDKGEYARYVILGGLMAVGTLAFVFTGGTVTFRVWFLLYGLSMVISRAVTTIKGLRSKKIKVVILNSIRALACILVIGFAFIPDLEDIYLAAMVVAIMMIFQMFTRLMGISMSQIRFDILKRIIARSMAAEVISGLLMLVFSFSLVFENLEPGIESYVDALWYCFAIVTTIGFGDITAVSNSGRVLSVILGFYGIIVVAVITSIIINFYTETKDVVMTSEDLNEGENALPENTEADNIKEPAGAAEAEESKTPAFAAEPLPQERFALVTFKVRRSLSGELLEQLGDSVSSDETQDGEEYVTVRVNCLINRQFYLWVMQHGDAIEITAPADIRQSFAEELKKVSGMYSDI